MDADRLLRLLRGRVSFRTVKGAVTLVEPGLYPYGGDEVPLLADADGGEDGLTAYTSGLRSMVLPAGEGRWLKVKGAGIPFGNSRPRYEAGRIYTYRLSDVNLGSGSLVWGFSTRQEAEAEVRQMLEARSLGLPSTRPVGIGLYPDTTVIEFRDRVELFEALVLTPREELRRRFQESGRRVEAACVLVEEPGDARADELLYGFLHPGVEGFLGNRDCRGFLRWLGSSCGLNLRRHHDAGLLHGTVPRGEGYMTNSHAANHIVTESKTLVTDYHMSSRSRDPALRDAEAYFLAVQMNPLPRAAEEAAKIFGQPKPAVFSLPTEASVPSPLPSFQGLYARPKESLEEYTEAWLDGVAYGYNRRILRDVEASVKSCAMLTAAACKKDLFRLLGLPEGMERGSEEVARRLAARAFREGELRDAEKMIRADVT